MGIIIPRRKQRKEKPRASRKGNGAKLRVEVIVIQMPAKVNLTETDIEAIASAVVRKLREEDGLRLDAEYEASLPVEEQKRRGRERMRQQDRERKDKPFNKGGRS